MKNKIYVIAAILGTAAITSCVKDDLYNTPHPEHGKVTVTADWSDRGDGIAVPEKWVVNIGEYTGEETAGTHSPDYLFEPDEYRMTAYSPAEGITVSGTTATVSPAPDNGDSPGSFVSNAPGWMFTHVQDIVIEKDRDHVFTARMAQQVRQLTLVIAPSGDAKDRIESMEGTLSGVAGTFDMATGEHGTPSDVKLSFTKITGGDDAGKWTATIRLLGIAGRVQKLSGTILFTGGNPQPVRLESDLTASLKEFNTGKTEPLTLGGSVVETPTEAGAAAAIDGWKDVTGDPVEAM
ncbi:MAG: hypothetical protein LUC96_13470 [Alistipes sp.]|uniref:hypothetical protein n=1 Tax=Alistipes sp. TaxID=1872444 RepID=UPI0025BA02E2|nr:hypothetical protein [Alistipes sp.]MCD8275966.1 hypothetical protein [Alistipes sp.]